MASTSSITPKNAYARVNQLRIKKHYTWNKLAKLAGIPVSSWMTGVPYTAPSDEELEKLAPVLDTTFEYLKYGTTNA